MDRNVTIVTTDEQQTAISELHAEFPTAVFYVDIDADLDPADPEYGTAYVLINQCGFLSQTVTVVNVAPDGTQVRATSGAILR